MLTSDPLGQLDLRLRGEPGS